MARHITTPEKMDVMANAEKDSEKNLAADYVAGSSEDRHEVIYRLYKRRFAGLIALVNDGCSDAPQGTDPDVFQVFLNIVAAMSWPWFGPISNDTDFNITLDQVNWLGNIVALVYLPTAFLIPYIVARYGLRRCVNILCSILLESATDATKFELGAVTLILSAWIRYAGTVEALSGQRAYALLMIGQFIASIAQPTYQVLGPKYSEVWFNLQGRTTATMIVAISNPIGGAVGQLISPLIGNARRSILVLGIVSTAVTPLIFLIGNAPPTPPTYAGSKPSPSLLSLLRAMAGQTVHSEAYLSSRQRIDFAIIIIIFGTLVAASNAFAVLTAQIFQPEGYSADTSGFMGACLLLTGIVAAILTAPLFDHVFTHKLALTTKILAPCIAVAWLSLIWAVKPGNEAGLFVVMTIIGVCSVTMLPVGLELACEVTRNADGSSAILWFTSVLCICFFESFLSVVHYRGNLFGVMFILVQGALRADENATPPLNMHRALIFNGNQVRKRSDEEKFRETL
ncbi:hypothetical protein Ac2012v2_004531 [Leucoagaricus gongylophorus]